MQSITWHVEWVFPSAPALRTSCRVHEDTPARYALAVRCARCCVCVRALTRARRSEALRAHFSSHNAALDAAARHEARHVAETLPSVCFFLEKVGVPAASAARWTRLDGDAPLRTALAGKWLLEFPTLHVALPAECAAYPLAASDAPEGPPPGNAWI